MKKMISLILTVMLVATSLVLVPTSASVYAASPIVFMDNLKWDSFYIYEWDSLGTEYAGQWPGTPLQPVETTDEYNLYEIYLDYEAEGFIVNNGAGLQTFDIPADRDVYGYTFTGKTSTDDNYRTGYEIAEITQQGKTAEPDDVKRFYISKKPLKTEYYPGEAFDPTGMEITIDYFSGETEIIKDITPENFTEKNFTLKVFNSDNFGSQLVRIAYTDKKGVNQYVSFFIKVRAKATGIEITHLPYQTSCIVGENFSLQGMEVNLLLEDGTKKKLSMLPNPNAPIPIVLTNSVGWSKMFAVVRDKNGTEKTIKPTDKFLNDYGEEIYSFTLPGTAQSVYFTDGGDNRTTEVENPDYGYYIDSTPPENGEWELCRWASDGDNETITDGYTLSPLARKAGRQTVTVTYHEFTATFEVDVFDRGDVNRDFNLNVVDVTAIQKSIAELMTFDDFEQQLADLNGDGRHDVTDATMLQLQIAETA